MAYVASTSLSVALPAIQREFGARGADLLWISNSYVIVQASLLIVCGSLSDRYGRNRVCLIGILLFALASLASGASPNLETLILSRFAQGFGSAMIVPTSLAIVSAYFSGSRHGWAIGLWSACTLLTSGLGPFIGGLLTEMGVWRFVFYIHIPFGMLAALVLWRYVPESYDIKASRKLGVRGSLLVTLSLLGLTYGFIEAPQRGFSHTPIWLSVTLGGLAFALFIWGEYRGGGTIMPLDLFRSRTFRGATASTFLFYVAIGPVLLYIPLNMIQAQGYSESFVGIATFPMTMLMLFFSAYIGGVVDRRGPRGPIVLGHLICVACFLLLARIGISNGQEDYWATFFAPVCLAGIGFGITLAPLAAATMGAVEDAKAGIASGISNTVSRVGQVLAVAIVGGLMLSQFNHSLLEDPAVRALPDEARAQLQAAAVDLAETRLPASLTAPQREAVKRVIDDSFVQANNLLFLISAAVCLLSAIVAWFTIEKRIVKRREDLR